MFDPLGMTPGPKRLPAVRQATLPDRICTRGDSQFRQQHRALARPLSAAEQWWRYARTCAGALRAGRSPTPVEVYGPVLTAGEQGWLNIEVGYSRYCGASADYSSTTLMVAGRPAVMFGALAVQGVINHRRKIAAERRAAARWRWHQNSSTVVTTDRLICSTQPHGLVSLWFGDCTEFHPDLQQWTLTLGFESLAPVRFTGLAVPVLSVLSGYGIFGEAWASDPRLAALL